MKHALAIALLLCATGSLSQEDFPQRFQFPATVGLFEKIRVAPGFDLSKPATFGYFFNSVNVEHINSIRSRLEAEGFAFVETHVDSTGRTWLQVAKSEIHSPESLVERNRKFKLIADTFESMQYDGWDIERNAR